jgi:hypothetical protein
MLINNWSWQSFCLLRHIQDLSLCFVFLWLYFDLWVSLVLEYLRLDWFWDLNEGISLAYLYLWSNNMKSI